MGIKIAAALLVIAAFMLMIMLTGYIDYLIDHREEDEMEGEDKWN